MIFSRPKCPIYIVNDGSPDPRRELFGGFTEWIVKDGQRRRREENLQDNHHHPPSYGGLDMGHDGTPLTPADRGGLRELLLFHTIFLFLGDLIKYLGSLVKYTDQKGCDECPAIIHLQLSNPSSPLLLTPSNPPALTHAPQLTATQSPKISTR